MDNTESFRSPRTFHETTINKEDDYKLVIQIQHPFIHIPASACSTIATPISFILLNRHGVLNRLVHWLLSWLPRSPMSLAFVSMNTIPVFGDGLLLVRIPGRYSARNFMLRTDVIEL